MSVVALMQSPKPWNMAILIFTNYIFGDIKDTPDRSSDMNDKELNQIIIEASIIGNTIYQEVLEKIVLSESTKLSLNIIEAIDTQNLFRQYLAYLITRQKMLDRPITIQDMQKAIDNILRGKQAEYKWSDEELQSQINSQVGNPDIIQSLYFELRKNKVPYLLPK
jgi:hypothetical protein